MKVLFETYSEFIDLFQEASDFQIVGGPDYLMIDCDRPWNDLRALLKTELGMLDDQDPVHALVGHLATVKPIVSPNRRGSLSFEYSYRWETVHVVF